MDIIPIKYEKEQLLIIDQTLLPNEMKWLRLETKEAVWDAIHRLRVRGAPAIGIAAAFGVYISMRDSKETNVQDFILQFERNKEYLDSARPTAVNLRWALERMQRCLLNKKQDHLDHIKDALLAEAEKIRQEDEENCRLIGEHGLTLLKPGMGILTHCNAGALATAKYGTALSPLYLGHKKGYNFKVLAGETRPLLQGSRLTAWELSKAGIDVTLICDNMASIVMKEGRVDAVLVGCDRMAANGDGANKIGTSGLAILAKEYGIPFYMFVPSSTIDIKTPTGAEIPIELRKGEEIYKLWYENDMAPSGIKTYNPAFDITEAKYITAVVTEKGIVYPPYKENLKEIVLDNATRQC